MNAVLLYVAAALTAGWGVSHLFPTRSVVNGFGDISRDNRLVITMEWIMEGLALIAAGAVVAVVTVVDRDADAATAAYLTTATALIAYAIVSLLTGARIKFLPYQLCPVIFTGSAVLIALGATI